KATRSPSQTKRHVTRPPGTHEKDPLRMRTPVTAARISTYGIARSHAPTGPSGPQCAWRVDKITARTNPATTTAALSSAIISNSSRPGAKIRAPQPGRAENRLGRAFGDDPPLFDQIRALRGSERDSDILLDQEHRSATGMHV